MKNILNPETVIGDCLENAFKLKTYCYLIDCASKDRFVATDEFRKKYNGFFRVRSRTARWYNRYYALLEEQKSNPRTFSEILRELYPYDNNLEVSFASKLIATMDTSKPVWDQYVIDNLGLKKEWEQSKKLPFEERVRLAEYIYAEIGRCYRKILRSPEGQQCIDRFDSELPEYKDVISDVKKIDFLLWQRR